MTRRRKANSPPVPLNEEDVDNPDVKLLIQNVNRVANGSIFVYMWNIADFGEKAPVGLAVNLEKILIVVDAMESLIGKKTILQDGVQFDLSSYSKIKGTHMNFYHGSGQMLFQGGQIGTGKNRRFPPSLKFIHSGLIDILHHLATALQAEAKNSLESPATTTGTDIPEINTPGINTPGINAPGTRADTPGTNIPIATPAANAPGDKTPGTSTSRIVPANTPGDKGCGINAPGDSAPVNTSGDKGHRINAPGDIAPVNTSRDKGHGINAPGDIAPVNTSRDKGCGINAPGDIAPVNTSGDKGHGINAPGDIAPVNTSRDKGCGINTHGDIAPANTSGDKGCSFGHALPGGKRPGILQDSASSSLDLLSEEERRKFENLNPEEVTAYDQMSKQITSLFKVIPCRQSRKSLLQKMLKDLNDETGENEETFVKSVTLGGKSSVAEEPISNQTANGLPASIEDDDIIYEGSITESRKEEERGGEGRPLLLCQHSNLQGKAVNPAVTSQGGSLTESRREEERGGEERHLPLRQLSNPQAGGGVKTYKVFPVILKNSIPNEVKVNPKKLLEIVTYCKPNAQIESIRTLKSGDVLVLGKHPHDYNILLAEWPEHPDYGKLIPKLPRESTVDMSVVVRGVHTSVSNDEVMKSLLEKNIVPKEVTRIESKTTGPTNNIRIILDSKKDQEMLLKEKLTMFHQRFNVTPFYEDPKVLQCFRCQQFGHTFHSCTQQQACVRCGLDHRVSECQVERADSKCINCSGNHGASFKRCPAYREALEKTLHQQSAPKNLNSSPSDQTSLAREPLLLATTRGTYASAVAQSLPDNHELTRVLAAIAQCLNSMVTSLVMHIKNGFPYDTSLPFKVAADCGKKLFNIDIHHTALETLSKGPFNNRQSHWLEQSHQQNS
jgi:hypothetical protein